MIATRILKDAKGFSLIELVLVVAMISFIALLINNLPSALASVNRSRHTSIAREAAERQLESLRRWPFDQLTLGVYQFDDTDLSQLSEVDAFYEVENCPAQICAWEESEMSKPKAVTVKVTWKETGKLQTVNLVTLVSQGGVGH
ncbi:MAG: type II secretion system protein [Armatimonadetes bacterium]|nr:MAG: type II secretion system protein [Armatimonadota bacterium]